MSSDGLGAMPTLVVGMTRDRHASVSRQSLGRSQSTALQLCWHSRPRLAEWPNTAEGGCATCLSWISTTQARQPHVPTVCPDFMASYASDARRRCRAGCVARRGRVGASPLGRFARDSRFLVMIMPITSSHAGILRKPTRAKRPSSPSSPSCSDDSNASASSSSSSKAGSAGPASSAAAFTGLCGSPSVSRSLRLRWGRRCFERRSLLSPCSSVGSARSADSNSSLAAEISAGARSAASAWSTASSAADADDGRDSRDSESRLRRRRRRRRRGRFSSPFVASPSGSPGSAGAAGACAASPGSRTSNGSLKSNRSSKKFGDSSAMSRRFGGSATLRFSGDGFGACRFGGRLLAHASRRGRRRRATPNSLAKRSQLDVLDAAGRRRGDA